MDLDTRLDEAAPRAVDQTPELQELLDRLVIAARPAPVRRRARRRLAVLAGGVAVAGALTATGAAAAAIVMSYTNANVPDSLVDASFPWTSREGHPCKIGLHLGPRADDDPRHSSSQQAELAAAETWAASFDIESIDRADAEKRWLEHMHLVSADHRSPAQLRQVFRGDELEGYALQHEVMRQLDEHLEGHGFDPRSLNSGASVECPE